MLNKMLCLASIAFSSVIWAAEKVTAMVQLLASGKVPSATGGVFDLMGASWAH